MLYGQLPQGHYYVIRDGRVFSAIKAGSGTEYLIGEYEQTEDGVVETRQQAPTTWEEVEDILQGAGYSDSEIEDYRNSVRCLHEDEEWDSNAIDRQTGEKGAFVPNGEYYVNCGVRDHFQGSLILDRILGDIGFDGGWWSVRPSKEDGDTCYDEFDGVPSRGVVIGGRCRPEEDKSLLEDCSLIIQENAEECETDLDNLVECTDNLVTFDVANPDDENGNPVPPTTVERPVYARSQEDCDNNTNTLFNCGGGILPTVYTTVLI